MGENMDAIEKSKKKRQLALVAVLLAMAVGIFAWQAPVLFPPKESPETPETVQKPAETAKPPGEAPSQPVTPSQPARPAGTSDSRAMSPRGPAQFTQQHLAPTQATYAQPSTPSKKYPLPSRSGA